MRLKLRIAVLIAATAAAVAVPGVATAASGSASGGGCTINYASWYNQPSNSSTAWTQLHSSTPACDEARVRLQYSNGTYTSWDYDGSLAVRIMTGQSPKAQHGFRVGSSWYGLNSTPHVTYG